MTGGCGAAADGHGDRAGQYEAGYAGTPPGALRRSLVAEEYNHERLDGDDFLATDWVPPSREKARVQHVGVPRDGM